MLRLMSAESEQRGRDGNKCRERHITCHPSFPVALAPFFVVFDLEEDLTTVKQQ